MAAKTISPELMSRYKTQYGETLESLTTKQPVLLVFLRHFGCTFCREAVAELSELRRKIEANGTQLAFVHLAGSDEKARKFFGQHSATDWRPIGRTLSGVRLGARKMASISQLRKHCADVEGLASGTLGRSAGRGCGTHAWHISDHELRN
jgi:hypothetical protein